MNRDKRPGKAPQQRDELRRAGRIPRIGRRLVHVAGLRRLELERVDAARRRPVVSGDVSALEATVHHAGKVGGARQHERRASLYGRSAARAVDGAEIQIGQASREKPRDAAPDRMAIEQDRIAMVRAHAFDLGGQKRVIWIEILRAARCHFGGVRRVAFHEDRLVRERAAKAKAHVRGIEKRE